MKNIENCKLVLAQIEKHPETWNQGTWHCGSSHCFTGLAQIYSGKPADEDSVRRDARIFLGLSFIEANYYFNAVRTLKELKTVLENFYNRDGFGRDGFDRDGFNRYGFDRNGFDRDGFNRDGFDRNGFNRYGFDRDGLDINNKPKF